MTLSLQLSRTSLLYNASREHATRLLETVLVKLLLTHRFKRNVQLTRRIYHASCATKYSRRGKLEMFTS
jgi:hypothetical protein